MIILKSLIITLLILSYISTCFGFLEVSVGFISYAYEKLSCNFVTCCTDREIPGNFEALRTKLRSEIFGQPLVESTVVNALKSHWYYKTDPEKALTLSFHGGPGVGKNYVTKFIQEALYSQGMESPHVHYFNARLNFPEVGQVSFYQKNLASWIKGNVSLCPKQLFIFDEVNQMPSGVLDVIKPFIDHLDYVNGINYRKSIYIFLSNTGSSVINEKAYDLWNMGIDRNDMTLDLFEKLIAHGAFNENGGFHHAEAIRSNLIDHYVPFLPLLKSHVKMCVYREFQKIGVNSPSDKQIQEVLEYVDFGPDPNNGIFSKTGCKRISQKVRVLAAI